MIVWRDGGGQVFIARDILTILTIIIIIKLNKLASSVDAIAIS